MKCNGCGGEFETTGGVFGYGDASISNSGAVTKMVAYAEYMKTLCPRCQHVLKDILLSSDLSDHWHKYDWELKGDIYVEGYDNGE